jgi:NTE family protein
MDHCSRHAAGKYLPMPNARPWLGICLSGGGYRAALFHLGCLRRLNELGLLPLVKTVSATSGGAIAGGLLARVWPRLETSDAGNFGNFEQLVEKPLWQFAEQRIRGGFSIWDRLQPKNWGKMWRGEYSSTDRLAAYFDRRITQKQLLTTLPDEPRFLFLATNLATGGVWELSRERVGEALVGFTPPGPVSVGEAMAAAAADPMILPPMILRFQPRDFHGSTLGPDGDSLRTVAPLVDGSIRDCMALGPAWRSHRLLIALDAGRPFDRDPKYDDWLGNRLWRSLAVAERQAKELTKRWFVSSLIAGNHEGAYIHLGAYHGHYGLDGSVGYSADVVDEIAGIKVSFAPLTPDAARIVVNHGYTIADAAVRRYLPGQFLPNVPLALPFADLTDRSRVLGLLAQTGPAPKTSSRKAA